MPTEAGIARRICNRYVLISVGTMAAYWYSVFSIIYGRAAHGPDYKVSRHRRWQSPFTVTRLGTLAEGVGRQCMPAPESGGHCRLPTQALATGVSSTTCELCWQAVEFFETSALLITFIALGKLLEGAAKGRTSRVRAVLNPKDPPVSTAEQQSAASVCQWHGN
jgi:P-type Cu+ transporter